MPGGMRLKVAIGRINKVWHVLLLVVASLMGCARSSSPDIRVEDAWARPAAPMGDMESSGSSEGGMEHALVGTGAVFMLLANDGGGPDRLVGGATDVAEVVEIHETVVDDDIMRMQMLPDGLPVPARGDVLLKPGGYHLMLIGIKRELKPGDSFALNLEFEKSGTLTINPDVRGP